MSKNLRKSNAAHKRLRDNYSSVHRKHYYHQECIAKQNREKRVLTKRERKKIWQRLSVTPY